MNSPTGQTCRWIFTLGGSNDADSRKDVHFGGFVDTAPHFGVKSVFNLLVNEVLTRVIIKNLTHRIIVSLISKT